MGRCKYKLALFGSHTGDQSGRRSRRRGKAASKESWWPESGGGMGMKFILDAPDEGYRGAPLRLCY